MYVQTASIYLFKVNKRNARKMYEICSKLILKTSKRRRRFRFGDFIIKFEYISHIVLMFQLLTLDKCMAASLTDIIFLM